MSPSDDYSYKVLTKSSTGSNFDEPQHKFIVVPHGRFEIELCLTEDGRFVSVTEVRVKKDFRTTDQRLANTGSFDVEQFYQD